MLRMEIALFLILVLVGYIYFSTERRNTALHQTFSLLLIVLQIHLLFDAATVYTVNHLDTVPAFLNAQLHRAFIGSMVLAVFLFYQYISILVEEETGRPRRWIGRRKSSCCWLWRGIWCSPSTMPSPHRATIPTASMWWCAT